MGFLRNLTIAKTQPTLEVLLRALNDRLTLVKEAVNTNLRYAYPQVQAIIETTGTWTIYIPTSDFEIEGWIAQVTGTTTSPTLELQIDDVAIDSQTLTTTSVTEYTLAAPEPVTRLQKVQVETGSMTAGEVLLISVLLRRTTDAVGG